MNISFVAGFGPIVRDVEASRRFYEQTLQLPMEGDEEYRHTAALEGVKHFALWQLSAAAESCFGVSDWPEGLPVPQAWLELDVEDVEAATNELAAAGYSVLIANREEPWGQTVTRLLSPEGLLVGITYTPFLRSK